MSLKPKLDVYPVENYIQSSTDHEQKTGTAGGSNVWGRANAASPTKPPRRKTPLEKLLSLKAHCQEESCVASVEAVLIAHLHRHPHILLLKQTIARNRDASGGRVLGVGGVYYRLPGGRCRRGEAEEAALLRKLGRHLLGEEKAKTDPPGDAIHPATSETVVEVTAASPSAEAANFFRVGEVLARWYRPHFSPLMYPYIPSHISASDVKEVRTIFLVHMKPIGYFNLAPDMELVAVPLFDLYENTAKYGPVIASLPATLSRVLINYCSSEY
ncbi:unnamed protein product [Phytomonas sp. EM1]|nr:unnamed protein product [Phytomonas sp. EM1]|eukprot:CCW64092.1 unnamed protein product [Phytomonas sp. isolate EM1]